jgi:hypothetical protein
MGSASLQVSLKLYLFLIGIRMLGQGTVLSVCPTGALECTVDE